MNLTISQWIEILEIMEKDKELSSCGIYRLNQLKSSNANCEQSKSAKEVLRQALEGYVIDVVQKEKSRLNIKEKNHKGAILMCLNGGELKQYCTAKECIASKDCQYYHVNVAINNLKTKMKYIVMENAGHLFDAYFEDFEKELKK